MKSNSLKFKDLRRLYNTFVQNDISCLILNFLWFNTVKKYGFTELRIEIFPRSNRIDLSPTAVELDEKILNLEPESTIRIFFSENKLEIVRAEERRVTTFKDEDYVVDKLLEVIKAVFVYEVEKFDSPVERVFLFPDFLSIADLRISGDVDIHIYTLLDLVVRSSSPSDIVRENLDVYIEKFVNSLCILMDNLYPITLISRIGDLILQTPSMFRNIASEISMFSTMVALIDGYLHIEEVKKKRKIIMIYVPHSYIRIYVDREVGKVVGYRLNIVSEDPFNFMRKWVNEQQDVVKQMCLSCALWSIE